MKKLLPAIAGILLLTVSCTENNETTIYDVTGFGAVGDGITDCTSAINTAISECSAKGGVVLVPQGSYLCSTIVLSSNVELRLEEGSEIVASLDPESYKSFIPQRDMSRYDSGDGTLNQNNSKDERWNRALILANGAHDIAITGKGVINGRHVFDPLGEERMRGPHGIVFGDCSNVRLDGVTITCAANYAFMGYALKNAEFVNVSISEGWDGIHIRGGENVLIEGCRFETGDDSIAGGYWTNMEIRECYVNSSCNGLRMIMPSENVDIHNCLFLGPGHYPHRTSGEARRTNMLFGIVFEPGGWGAAPGDLKGLKVHDCVMENVSSPLAASISQDNTAYDLSVRNLKASGIYGTMTPLVCYNDKGFEKLEMENYTISR